MRAIRLALVGVGKIAVDQHVPALAGNADFMLVATASPQHGIAGIDRHTNLESLLAARHDIDAVAICTPPQLRHDIARLALEHGCHVLLEKPPGTSIEEVEALCTLAQQRGLALFASWHSREAAGVEPARAWLANRRIHRVQVEWKEDVRVWHPGQTWIWKAGGLGVFDPGINALSILTHILPGTLALQDAKLAFPSNCETPIAARLRLENEQQADVSVELDFLHPGKALWDIRVETNDGQLKLSQGGAILHINGSAVVHTGDHEYRNLYRRFALLITKRHVDVDITPMRLVTDALARGHRRTVARFAE